MPHSHQDAFCDVKAEEHYSEDEAFVQNGIDERLIAKSRPQVKILTDKQNLGENERVDHRKGVFLIIQMVL
jgi:hypothetical protein